jgi:plasmid stabilization system protein ParE
VIVSLAPAAQADLDDIWLHIAQDDPDAANAVITFLERTFLSHPQQFLNELDKKLWYAADRLRVSLDAAAILVAGEALS